MPITYNKLEEFVSQPRLNRYLVSCNNSHDRALKLYAANIHISQAFYPILNLFETFLRNSINEKLSFYFSDSNWILTQETGFMSDVSLGPSFWLKKQVANARNNTRGVITPGKIIAEQTFGFWTSLFEPRYYRLIGGSVLHCFPHKPTTINRLSIANLLTDIRKFRNRIYHNEVICLNNITIDFNHSTSIKNQIHDLLTWMDSDLSVYALDFDNIEKRIDDARGI